MSNATHHSASNDPWSTLHEGLRRLAPDGPGYLDRWSIVHFAAGFLLGIAVIELGFSIPETLLLALLLLIVWRQIEKNPSSSVNQYVDILLGMLGVLLAALCDTLLDFGATGILSPDLTFDPDNLWGFLRLIVLLVMFFCGIVIPIQDNTRRGLNEQEARGRLKSLLDALKRARDGAAQLPADGKEETKENADDAKEEVDDADYSGAVEEITEIEETLKEIDGAGADAAKEGARIARGLATLMQIKQNWQAGNNEWGVKDIRVECNSGNTECAIVIVIDAPGHDNQTLPIDPAKRDDARRIVDEFKAKLTRCDWPDENDARALDTLLKRD